MFLGHFAVALSARRVSTRPSLGWMFAACQFPDLLWPIFVLTGVERVSIDPGNTAVTPLSFDHYPWSHSLAMDVLWGVALGAMYFALRRNARGAVVVGALVVSHWLLDWLTHRPDLPIVPGSASRYGLELWNNVPATLATETLFFAGGVWLYVMFTRARDTVGRAGFWVLVAFLAGTYLANVFGPPPPSTALVATSALALWLLVPIAAWIDRHRTSAPTDT